jgi:hypothetical protein
VIQDVIRGGKRFSDNDMRKIKEGWGVSRFDQIGMRASESPPGRRGALVERLSAFHDVAGARSRMAFSARAG